MELMLSHHQDSRSKWTVCPHADGVCPRGTFDSHVPMTEAMADQYNRLQYIRDTTLPGHEQPYSEDSQNYFALDLYAQSVRIQQHNDRLRELRAKLDLTHWQMANKTIDAIEGAQKIDEAEDFIDFIKPHVASSLENLLCGEFTSTEENRQLKLLSSLKEVFRDRDYSNLFDGIERPTQSAWYWERNLRLGGEMQDHLDQHIEFIGDVVYRHRCRLTGGASALMNELEEEIRTAAGIRIQLTVLAALEMSPKSIPAHDNRHNGATRIMRVKNRLNVALVQQAKLFGQTNTKILALEKEHYATVGMFAFDRVVF